MKIRTLGRHLREGLKNIGRNGWMTFASISSVAITLLILGVFLLLALNINFMAGKVESEVEIRAYLDLHAGVVERLDTERQLKAIPEVESIEFIPKSEGIDNFLESLGEQSTHFDSLRDENPLPDTFVIKLNEPQEALNVSKKIEALDHIYRVNDGAGFVDALFSVTNTVRNVGLIFIIGLAFTAMMLISNTIKTTIASRKREIEIMKLVGATNNFIRFPFFIEGLLLGVIGAAIPILILYVGYEQLLARVYSHEYTVSFFELLPLYPLVYQMGTILLGIGAFIGVWGSITSVRKYLKI